MEVSPVAVVQYFDGQKQNLIPLFQRPYQWTENNWSTFWDDLITQYTDEKANTPENHFMGTIVSIPATSIPIGVNKYLIIDGQQRLTTIAILLCVLRDYFKLVELDNYAGKIQNLYLTNQYQGVDDTLKFVPTQTLNDREIYRTIVIDQTIPNDARHLMVKCYYFFMNKINTKVDDDVRIEPEKLLLTLEKKFQVVMINLGKEDDPYLIFESLNFKGAPLTQADLVRNYILMQFKHSISSGGEQERIYKKYWMPLGEALIIADDSGKERDYLTDFLRHYAMRNGENVLKNNVYDAIKKEMRKRTNESMEAIVEDISKHGMNYKEIISPTRIDSKIAQRLNNIRQLDTTVVYPLLLKLVSMYDKNNISSYDLAECLASIESFIVRRSVCNVPANSLGKIFLSIAKEIDNERHIPISLHQKLSDGAGNSRFPDNEEFHSALTTNNSLYLSKISKYLLDQLEIAHNHKEIVNLKNTTIEHIMPQTLSEVWITDLGIDYDQAYKSLIHTIGNLTLTGYNSEMSNKSFSDKKEILEVSHISLNDFILKKEKWGINEIKERAEHLAAIAVKIWSAPTKKITT